MKAKKRGIKNPPFLFYILISDIWNIIYNYFYIILFYNIVYYIIV